MIVNIEKKQTLISVDEKVNKSIFVCSHERSGTHFLMNSIAINSNYTVNPYLNFDLIPLGDTINFYSSKNIKSFVDKISNIENKNKKYGLSSLIKTHHPAYIFENLYNSKDIFFLYIYRNPLDTLLSFWKFIHHWNWHEGPKLNTPLKFIKAAPEGQMQRYQKKTYKNIFLRWAFHLSDWIEASKNCKNIYLVNYNDLDLEFKSTVSNIFNYLDISFNSISKPSRDNFVKTTKISVTDDDYEEFVNYIYENLSLFPDIEKILKIK